MTNHCTLFDKNYLLYGLALHASLLRHAAPFRLFMLAMDETCEAALRTLALEHVVVVPLEHVITERYAFVRERMSFGQMCWTSQPLLCRHVLDNFGAESVTYLESDSYFFAPPERLFEEVGAGSVSLVPHAYAPGDDRTATSGIYCVQFNLFRGDAEGRRFLDLWEEACLRYDRSRTGYYPGQLCMDDWPSRSSAVCVVRNKGAGVAPWNVSRYLVAGTRDAPTVDGVPVVFYHFHELAFMQSGEFFLSSYPIPPAARELIYGPYVDELDRLRRHVERAVPGFRFRKTFESPGLWRSLAKLSVPALRSYLRFRILYQRGRKNMIRSGGNA